MKRIVFLLVLVFILSLFVHLPAGFVSRFLMLPSQFVLASPSGTIWRGSFELVQWQGRNLGSLSWTFRPWRIFVGKMDINFALEGQSSIAAKGNAGIGFSGAYARNVELDISSAFIDSVAQYPLPMNSKGSLNFNIDDYSISSPWCTNLNGNGLWRNAAIVLPLGEVELGNVNANFSCQEGSILVQSVSSSDELETNLNLSFSPQSRYRLQGSLLAKENLPRAIRNQLQWLGEPDSQGRYSLEFSG